MKIAIDLDDTLSFVDRVTRAAGYIERKGLPYRLADENAHALTQVFDWDIEAVLEFVREGGITIFTEAEVRKGAREVLEALHAAGHEIVILTARQKEWFVNPETVSRDWLEKRKIPYDDIVADIPFGEKGKYCAENGISVLIDDNVESCISAQEQGVTAVLFIDKSNLSRAREVRCGASNWKQIAEILKRILTAN